MFETAAIGSAAKFNVSEVLREAGPQVTILATIPTYFLPLKLRNL
jgi:hypothetical protein